MTDLLMEEAVSKSSLTHDHHHQQQQQQQQQHCYQVIIPDGP